VAANEDRSTLFSDIGAGARRSQGGIIAMASAHKSGILSRVSAWVFRRETLFGAVAALLVCAGVAAWYLLQPTVLTIAVAPRDGTEPELIAAYADALDASHEGIRLKVVSFDNVRDSAAALQGGQADLAVVRPDVLLPTNGLTLAILRDQAMMIISPSQTGIEKFPDLSGKRLGIGVHRDADVWLLRNILGYYNLRLHKLGAAADGVERIVRLVPVNEAAVEAAFQEGAIDAFVSIIAPTAPKAMDLIAAVRRTSQDGTVKFIAIEDDHALIERYPKLQAVTVPGGTFTGDPKLPAEDVKTIGASYRLMARASLSRPVAADVTQQIFEKRSVAAQKTGAADYIQAPAYESTSAATSARIPIHQGAIDYYEREQHNFIERYGDTLYLFGALAGFVISVLAWIRQRLARLRREHIDEIIERLLEIIDQARTLRDPDAIEGLNIEVDRLATEAVRYTCENEPDAKTLSAASIAIDTARKTISDCRKIAVEPRLCEPAQA